MMIPLYPKLVRNLGASPFVSGLIGNNVMRGCSLLVVFRMFKKRDCPLLAMTKVVT